MSISDEFNIRTGSLCKGKVMHIFWNYKLLARYFCTILPVKMINYVFMTNRESNTAISVTIEPSVLVVTFFSTGFMLGVIAKIR